MKKFFAILLAAIMMLSMVAMADGTITTPNSNTTEDTNAALETYTAYKIFDVTKVTSTDGEGKTTVTGYAYTIPADDAWVTVLTDEDQTWLKLTLSADGTVYTVDTEIDNGAALAQYLKDNIPTSKTGKELVAGDNNVADGYYLITSTMGSALGLCTTDFGIDITEKNSYPSVTKTVAEKQVSIGDTVHYTITVTIPATADKNVIVHDVMDAGLTLDTDSVKVNGTAVTPTTEGLTDGCTFELTLDPAIYKNSTVTITYEAELNSTAVIFESTNNNKAYITYSAFKSKDKVVTTETYKFDLNKVDGEGNKLAGAEFKLYAVEQGGTAIALIADGDNYRKADTDDTATTETIVVGADGTVVISGLGNGTYWLEETVAPVGYNKLATRKSFTIADKNLIGETGVNVVNNTGSELPSTGGMGTTIFYVVGGMMMAAALVLLVSKRKVAASK